VARRRDKNVDCGGFAAGCAAARPWPDATNAWPEFVATA
jgi:hypothetical protein